MKDHTLNLRVDAETKSQLAKLAEADGRPVSSLVLKVLKDWLKSQKGKR